MLHRLLKTAVLCSVVLVAGACTYRYHTLRCITTVTVPHAESDVLTLKVQFNAYIAYISSNSDIAHINNRAVLHLVNGNVDDALTQLQTIIASNEPAVLNNYGVARILKGDFALGYEYIGKAALLKPDNHYFRKNYLYLHELKK
ncbi:MAG: hypothetical protein N3F66_10800 [Spirochaetes bacterium]|nr:hypothetical protein [Spirochaetota bacterium]